MAVNAEKESQMNKEALERAAERDRIDTRHWNMA